MARATQTLAGMFLLAGTASLFLAAAGTIDAGFTIQPSYVLFALAAVFGATTVWRGMRSISLPLQVAIALLVAAHVAALALGDAATISGSARAGASRVFVVLFELLFGLTVMFLIVGSYRGTRELKPLLRAFFVGAFLAGAYAVYQWPAQHFGWPGADVVNVADSNGVTSGGSQGAGILGWERTRGTFLEPHFLAAYLVSLLPLIVASMRASSRHAPRLLAVLAFVAAAPALLLTSSFPLWAILLLAGVAGLTFESVVCGRRTLSFVLAATLAVVIAFVPLAIVAPDTLSRVTGRSADELVDTTRFRSDSWNRAVAIWATRPVLGFGPGQSSVRLALDADVPADNRNQPPLQSAQGLWAAALVDVGVIGLGAWIAFLGLMQARSAVGASRSQLALRVGIWASALAAVIAAQISGDRLELTVWVLLGLALAATTRKEESADRDGSDE